MFKGGAGGSWGAGTFKLIKGMCKLEHFKFSTCLRYADWHQNHGMPWGEGPAKTYWERGTYGGNRKVARMPENMRKAMMEKAMLKSVRAKRANLDFYTAQSETSHTADAEPVPPNHVQPAKSGGVLSVLAVVGAICSETFPCPNNAKLGNPQASAARNAGKAPPPIIQGKASSSSGATPAPPPAARPLPKAIIARPPPPAGPATELKHQSECAFF